MARISSSGILGTSIESGEIAAGAVTAAKISLTDGTILRGNSSDIAEEITVRNMATISASATDLNTDNANLSISAGQLTNTSKIVVTFVHGPNGQTSKNLQTGISLQDTTSNPTTAAMNLTTNNNVLGLVRYEIMAAPQDTSQAIIRRTWKDTGGSSSEDVVAIDTGDDDFMTTAFTLRATTKWTTAPSGAENVFVMMELIP